MTKEQKSVMAMLENRELDEKELRSLVAKMNAKKRWDNTDQTKRKEHGKMLAESRKKKSTV